MSWKIVSFCLGVLLVAMVTGAPVSNPGVVKRADERIVFGNQQNKARVVSKRSDILDTDQTPDTPAEGELDKGSEVVAHDEKSVEKDLADRADAARKDFEDQDKIADAMEAAMQSVNVAKSDLQHSAETGSSQPIESGQAPGETSAEAVDEASQTEMGDGAQENDDQTVAAEDADIEDLLKATGEGHKDDQGETAEQSTGEAEPEQENQQPEPSGEMAVADDDRTEGQTGLGSDLVPQPGDGNGQLGDFWTQMYQYMDAYPASARLPFDLYRGRRSLASSKKSGSRRIKRDLLDDIEYDPALLQYLWNDELNTAGDDQYDSPPTSSVLDMGDSLLADQDDYVPLTESDAEYLYDELEEYLQWELQRRADILKLRETLGLAPTEEADSTDFANSYGGEVGSGDLGANDGDSYSYGAEYPSDNSPYYYASKRSSPAQAAYDLPVADTEKRYFFPFADEPGTHWGAFVPEKRGLEDTDDDRSAYLDDAYVGDYRGPTKRDYNEAIQRLQRLAMALSDNHDPYYTELVQDQPYKK